MGVGVDVDLKEKKWDGWRVGGNICCQMLVLTMLN